MIPSASDLTYFLEVAQLLNLSRAAETLGISQPSLTLAMQRLEENLGTSILIRQKRGVSLTKAGKQLQIHAKFLLEQWQNVKNAALCSTHEVQGCFTVGCHPSVAIYTLPHFLPLLMQAHPKLEIKLHHDLSRMITDLVMQFAVDVGIIINPIKHPDLIIKKIFNDKVTLWRRPNKTKEPSVLICDPSLQQTQAILKQLKQQHFEIKRLITTNNLEVIAELAASGCGIGILPTNIAATKSLVPIPKAPFYDDELCVVYHGENRNIKGIQVIVEAIKSISSREFVKK